MPRRRPHRARAANLPLRITFPAMPRQARSEIAAAWRWLEDVPAPLVLAALAAFALNALSLVDISFSTAPRVGGAGIAVLKLALVLALFALATCATIMPSLPAPAWPGRARGSLVALVALGVLWSAGQSVPVILRWPQAVATPQHYGSDEMVYAHYNAWLVLHGQNPYDGERLSGALRYFAVDQITPLRTGAFRDPLHPPTLEQTRALVATFLTNPAAPPPEIAPATTHSYPALSFLIAVPSVWAGLPTLGYAQIAGLLALIALILIVTPPRWRIVAGVLCLVDADGLRSVATSDFAIWTALGVGLIFALGFGRRHPHPILAAMFLGMACAVQQTAWFFAPFVLIAIWRKRGMRAAMYEGALALGAFLLINLPWIILSPREWLRSLVLPMTLPLFPTGVGLVGLGLGGALPLFPPIVYAILEVVAFAGALAAYWRWHDRFPYAGMILPLAAVMLAWRSPTRYIILLPFLAILAAALAARRGPRVAEHLTPPTRRSETFQPESA